MGRHIAYDVLDVKQTPEMKALAQKISDLQAEYAVLHEKQQRSQLKAYVHYEREMATNDVHRMFHDMGNPPT